MNCQDISSVSVIGCIIRELLSRAKLLLLVRIYHNWRTVLLKFEDRGRPLVFKIMCCYKAK
jgi:hypothetical protein